MFNMNDEFTKELHSLRNKLWLKIPAKLREIILLVFIAVTIYGVFQGVLKNGCQFNIGREKESNFLVAGNTELIANQFLVEIQGNVKILNNLLAARGPLNFKKPKPSFLTIAYDKYFAELHLLKSARQQIINFYGNLELIQKGQPYSRDMMLETKKQGMDALNSLEKDFSPHRFYQDDDPDGTVVSADLTTVNKVPYEAVGEIS